ncbi:MAG TPA: phosphatase [Actinomycetota bacterium]|nr:phosphatase [Actinomycetota bacterium]
MSSLTLHEARERLVAAGITGPHQSHSRENNLSKIRAMLDGDPDGSFGISGLDRFSAADVLGFLADLTGCSAHVDDCEGYDTLDPDRTVRGLVEAGRRLRDEARRGATLLTVTGHPTGMLEHHIHVVDAYRRAGGKVLRLREEEDLRIGKSKHSEVRYIGGVGCLADWGSLKHTHSPAAMEALLEAEPWPEIVLGDHGFAGAAIERGIPTIAIMDINDPALAVAHAQRRDVVIVPMDDNRPPRLYEPAWRLIAQEIAENAP